jgi:hypothetical protein
MMWSWGGSWMRGKGGGRGGFCIELRSIVLGLFLETKRLVYNFDLLG